MNKNASDSMCMYIYVFTGIVDSIAAAGATIGLALMVVLFQFPAYLYFKWRCNFSLSFLSVFVF